MNTARGSYMRYNSVRGSHVTDRPGEIDMDSSAPNPRGPEPAAPSVGLITTRRKKMKTRAGSWTRDAFDDGKIAERLKGFPEYEVLWQGKGNRIVRYKEHNGFSGRIAVETSMGWVDWPVLAGGEVRYDAPERVLDFVKDQVERLMAPAAAEQTRRVERMHREMEGAVAGPGEGKKFPGGFHVVYLPINQAWAVMWGEDIFGIFNEKKEAEYYASDPSRLQGRMPLGMASLRTQAGSRVMVGEDEGVAGPGVAGDSRVAYFRNVLHDFDRGDVSDVGKQPSGVSREEWVADSVKHILNRDAAEGPWEVKIAEFKFAPTDPAQAEFEESPLNADGIFEVGIGGEVIGKGRFLVRGRYVTRPERKVIGDWVIDEVHATMLSIPDVAKAASLRKAAVRWDILNDDAVLPWHLLPQDIFGLGARAAEKLLSSGEFQTRGKGGARGVDIVLDEQEVSRADAAVYAMPDFSSTVSPRLEELIQKVWRDIQMIKGKNHHPKYKQQTLDNLTEDDIREWVANEFRKGVRMVLEHGLARAYREEQPLPVSEADLRKGMVELGKADLMKATGKDEAAMRQEVGAWPMDRLLEALGYNCMRQAALQARQLKGGVR